MNTSGCVMRQPFYLLIWRLGSKKKTKTVIYIFCITSTWKSKLTKASQVLLVSDEKLRAAVSNNVYNEIKISKHKVASYVIN